MAEYLPFQDKHSIQEAQINLLFYGRFERQVIEATRGYAEAELSEIVPISAEVRGGSFEIDITNPSNPSPMRTMSSDLVGFQFSKVQGNGQQARVLQLTENPFRQVSWTINPGLSQASTSTGAFVLS